MKSFIQNTNFILGAISKRLVQKELICGVKSCVIQGTLSQMTIILTSFHGLPRF